VETGLVSSGVVRFKTGAGFRELRMLARDGSKYQFEMTMGRPVVQALHFPLAVDGKTIDSALIDVGNPQCAIALSAIGQSSFDFDWQTLGAAIEGHAYFPRRSNVSFFSRIEGNVIGARFYERGAGATLSSGTGATGAAVAARALGLVEGPVTVRTEAGDLQIRWENDNVFLAGPAQVIARGEYFGG
jgi:diaminopimelate epimerase